MNNSIDITKISLKDALKLREELDRYLAQVRSEINKVIASSSDAIRAPSPIRGRKVPPKYRGPNGETWAGRGAQPKWLTAAMKKGKKLENFLIKQDGASNAKRSKMGQG